MNRVSVVESVPSLAYDLKALESLTQLPDAQISTHQEMRDFLGDYAVHNTLRGAISRHPTSVNKYERVVSAYVGGYEDRYDAAEHSPFGFLAIAHCMDNGLVTISRKVTTPSGFGDSSYELDYLVSSYEEPYTPNITLSRGTGITKARSELRSSDRLMEMGALLPVVVKDAAFDLAAVIREASRVELDQPQSK